MTASGVAEVPDSSGQQPAGAAADDWLQYTYLEKLYGYLPGMLASQRAITIALLETLAGWDLVQHRPPSDGPSR
jgi:hypothetical protein